MVKSIRVPGVGVGAVLILAFVGFALTPGLASAADTSKNGVTFAKNVAPILQQKCQVCHHSGTAATMSLMTYEETRPWARSIRKRVAAREMPPWHLDKTVGIQKFKNDRSLTDDQIATIIAWVDADAPLGNIKDLPPPVQFQDEDQWLIGKPDLIMTTPEHVMYANGPDWWRDMIVETELIEDRYAKAIQTRPSKQGRRIAHHVSTTIIQDTGEAGRNEAFGTSTFFSEYAVGKYGDIFPEGTGRLMKAGSRIKFNVHYFAIGEEVRDRIDLGIVLYPKGVVPKYHAENVSINGNLDFDIPPGAVTKHDAYFRLAKPARIVSYQPHMHVRGKAMCMEAIHLNGRRETLSCVDHFDFNWHVAYVYADDAAPLLPAGTMLHTIGIHDNSASNPRNPDPTLWVGVGQRSIDDMSNAHVGVVYLTDEDYDQQVAERKGKQ